MFCTVFGDEKAFKKVVEGYDEVIDIEMGKFAHIEPQFLQEYFKTLNIKDYIFEQYKELKSLRVTHNYNLFQSVCLKEGKIVEEKEVEGDYI